ncbi:hypothetical protein F2P81_021073 [Scophthalmus maximus]|uniref:Uncharacterized protein n=1 Tax=Scophthalmus maximus TaxID=52904 RepID=A0A6A4RUG2_SCOMX|nr:hypothetical protein F2P81_021073 [Scophthalmus maximus]
MKHEDHSVSIGHGKSGAWRWGHEGSCDNLGKTPTIVHFNQLRGDDVLSSLLMLHDSHSTITARVVSSVLYCDRRAQRCK